ncbi:MAG: alpha/beta fold hydrolase, partial [Vicinamibacteria bacterium]
IDFLAALDLDEVTLVGNDTGGAICQLVVTRHPERVGRLVLTPCDAYENFLPPAFRYLQLLARVPGGVGAVAQSMRIPAVRRTPLAFGWLSKSRIPAEVLAGWTAPIIREPGVRADARKVLRGISNSYTLEAAERLRDFEGPTMLAWATEDRFFKPRFAERLAADIPGSRLEWIDDSRTFVSEDQPERLTELIGDFATA